jgi:hypothetical protein
MLQSAYTDPPYIWGICCYFYWSPVEHPQTARPLEIGAPTAKNGAPGCPRINRQRGDLQCAVVPWVADQDAASRLP